MDFNIIIPGPPIPAARPRVLKSGFSFSPHHSKLLKAKTIIRQQWNSDLIINSPVSIKLLFFMPIPKSLSKKKQDILHCQCLPHTKKPDIDNLVKFYMDCLNGVVYYDDSYVYSISAKKNYSFNPRTEIYLL